ncbi:peptide transporter [Paracoccaceae bacterium Fryx2]|nr:peptide transporter [Paracoccaceae bacterium Fryx2]
MCEHGLTLAFISHDLSVIRRLCSLIMVLHRGRIVGDTPAAQVFDAQQANRTRQLLAAIPLPDPAQIGD